MTRRDDSYDMQAQIRETEEALQRLMGETNMDPELQERLVRLMKGKLALQEILATDEDVSPSDLLLRIRATIRKPQ